jgi:hypothetical protein
VKLIAVSFVLSIFIVALPALTPRDILADGAPHSGTVANSSDGCCQGKRGNVNTIGIIDLSDLTALVQYLTGM